MMEKGMAVEKALDASCPQQYPEARGRDAAA